MIFINIISFYLIWFVCVLSGAGKFPELFALYFGILVVTAQLIPELFGRSKKLLFTRIKTIYSIVIAGVLIDSIPVITGFVSFPRTTIFLFVYPAWLIILWVMMATSMWLSLKKVISKPFYSVLFGVFGGPLSYWAGQYYGALEFPKGVCPALIIYSIEWGLLMLFFSCNRKVFNPEKL